MIKRWLRLSKKLKMMTLLLTIIGTIIASIISPRKKLWSIAITKTSLILFLSLLFYRGNKKILWNHLSKGLIADKIRTPLIVLRCWLIPVSILASIKSLSIKTYQKQQKFILIKLIILFALIITFSTSNLIIFF